MNRCHGTWLLLLVGCGTPDARPGAASTIDSSGVSIVTSTMPQWPAGAGWRIDTTPELVVGAVDRLPSVLLVAVTAARRLDDGSTVLSLDEGKRIRWFDRDGAEIRSVGGEGEDAGEYRSVLLAGMLGDSLLVWDEQLDRATVLARDGATARSFRPADDSTLAPFGLAVAGAFHDGRLLLAARSGARSGGTSGLRRDSIALGVGDREGRLVQLLARVPGHENVVVSGPGFVTIVPRPFGAHTVVAVDDNDLLVGRGDRDEVLRYHGDGVLAGIYRIDRPRRLIPATELAAQRQQLTAQLAQLPLPMADAIASALADAGIPQVYPAHDRILVDDRGSIWLREDIGPRRGTTEARHWDILDRQGRWLGVVTTPPRFDLHQVTDSRLVGIWRDEHDVEHLRVHRLKR